MKMRRIPFEVKIADVILVVISQGDNSGLINNETENWKAGCFCIFVVLLLVILGVSLLVWGFFFHFLEETTQVIWNVEYSGI